MDISLFYKGIIVGFSASAPLGPIAILIIQRTLNKGRLSGFISGLGASFADTIYATIAGLGLTMVITFVEEKQLFFEIASVALLFFLGIKIFYSNIAKQIRAKKTQRHTLFGDFISVMLLTISNPLALFLFIAVFAGLGLVVEKIRFISTLSFIIGVYSGAALWWFILTTLVNKFRDRFKLRSLWWINKIAGIIIVMFGLFAIAGMFFLNKNF